MCTECYRLAADKARYRILTLLSERGEMNVGDITDKVSVTQPTVTHHLKLLAAAKLVVSRRKGRESLFSLNGESECYTACGLLKGLGREPLGHKTDGRETRT